MKKLLTILLIICSLQGIGQEVSMKEWNKGISFNTLDAAYRNTNWVMQGTAVDVIFRRDTIILPIYYRYNPIDLMIQYADECYKDSTLEHTYKDYWYDNCYGQGGDLASGYYPVLICNDSTHYTWTHKTPTFAGFIVWIKER